MSYRPADSWFNEHFRAERKQDHDFISRDGLIVIEAKHGRGGVRELYSGVIALAKALRNNPQPLQGVLVLLNPDLAPSRLADEWDQVKSTLVPVIAQRLCLVAVGDGRLQTMPPGDDRLQRIGTAFTPFVVPTKPSADGLTGRRTATALPTVTHIEALKILVLRWLTRRGPISVADLATEVGCSYPTALKALKPLESEQLLSRHPGGAVELMRFPYDAWVRLLTISRATRRSFAFVDDSGQRPDLDGLLKRFARVTSPRLAAGGIAAGRYWDPLFDLHGFPRLDLTCHAPRGTDVDLGFVTRVDPALRIIAPPTAAKPVLVIHLLTRADPLFSHPPAAPGGGGQPGLAYADPLETALDLHEIGLDAQAGQLLRRLRPEVRL